MSTGVIFISFILLIRIIKWLAEIDSPVTVQQKRFVEPQPPPDKTPKHEYYEILNLKPTVPICVEDINYAYYKKLQQSSGERAKGKNPEYQLNDLKAARNYLIDFCAYAANKN